MAKSKRNEAAGGLSTKALVLTLAIGVLLGAAAVAVLLTRSAVIERRTGRKLAATRRLDLIRQPAARDEHVERKFVDGFRRVPLLCGA